MKVDLLEHNQEAYEKIREALASGIKKLAISHATGTGKSYLIGKLFEDYNDKRKLVLVPSAYIKEQMQKIFNKYNIVNADVMRLEALEKSEKAVADRERKITVQEKLSVNGLNKELADYLKDNADVDKLHILVNDIVKERIKENGYKPVEHSSDDKITSEEFSKWPYSKKAEYAERHPEAYKRLRGKK